MTNSASLAMGERNTASPQSYSLQSPNRAVPPLPGPNSSTSSSEEADTYHSVLHQISDKWRVIECKGNLQWILQRRSGVRRGTPRWLPHSYCTTSPGLGRFIREATGPLDGATRKFLASLPTHHPVPTRGR